MGTNMSLASSLLPLLPTPTAVLLRYDSSPASLELGQFRLDHVPNFVELTLGDFHFPDSKKEDSATA